MTSTRPTLELPITRPAVVSLDVVVAPSPSEPSAPSLARIRRFANLATIAVLFLGLGVPLFGYLFREPPPLDENRERHPFPPISIKRHVVQDFPRWFSMYFQDRVGYRDVLLRWHKHATTRWLDEPVSDQAWLGKNGWLFLNVADPFVRQPEKGTVNTRVEQWCKAFAERKAFLAARGIEYVVVLVPEKSAVYPEYLNGYAKRHPPPEPLAQAEQKLREAGVSCINLLPVLSQAKAEQAEQLYFNTDSHWTPVGSRVGYRALSEELSKRCPGLIPKADSWYSRRDHQHPGDLLRLTGDTDRSAEACQHFLPPPGRVQAIEEPAFAEKLPASMKPRHLRPAALRSDTATGPPLLLLRDSFGEALLPFLASDFAEVSVVGTHHFPAFLLDDVRPKVVVQEIAARFLYSTKPVNEPPVAGYPARR